MPSLKSICAKRTQQESEFGSRIRFPSFSLHFDEKSDIIDLPKQRDLRLFSKFRLRRGDYPCFDFNLLFGLRIISNISNFHRYLT